MQTRKWWRLILLACLIPLVAACEAGETQTPSPQSPGEVALSQPTRTVKPIVSFTPRFTATPLPSNTPVPSHTPTPTNTLEPPTETPRPSPTPTATAFGVIRSSQNVNLRDGPGSDQPVVTAISPGTEVGVLRTKADASGADWYEITLVDDEGNMQRLWVFGALLDTNYNEVVSATLEAVEVAGAESSGGTPADVPDATPTPTRTPGPTPVPESVNILAYCEQKRVRPPSPTTNDSVYIEWSWYVAREELMQQHLDNANYEVMLDGEPLEGWNQYATEMRRESGTWIVYWYYPVGSLEAGEHRVDFRLTWDEAITDGYKDFGPGTANEVDEGGCTFTVREAA